VKREEQKLPWRIFVEEAPTHMPAYVMINDCMCYVTDYLILSSAGVCGYKSMS
jgi:hypothetical protein